MKENEPMVASFNERLHGKLKFSGMGVLDGRKDILQMRGIRSHYYFLLNQYHDEKVSYIRYGGTSPLLSDGLTKFKRSLRAIPNRKNLYGEKSLWLMPMNTSKALTEFLRFNPFLFIENHKMYRAIFPCVTSGISKEEFLMWLKEYNFHGISGTKIYCQDGGEKIEQWIAEEDLPNHEVFPFFKINAES